MRNECTLREVYHTQQAFGRNMGAKNEAYEEDASVFVACPVFSCNHNFYLSTCYEG